MTEAQWLNCCDSIFMLEALPRGVSERKLRLFAVACCKRQKHLLSADFNHALEIAEKLADVPVPTADLLDAAVKVTAQIKGSQVQQCIAYAVQATLYSPEISSLYHTAEGKRYSVDYIPYKKSTHESFIEFAKSTAYHIATAAGLSILPEARSSVDSNELESVADITQIEYGVQASILRDIFKSPFSDVNLFCPSNQKIVDISSAIYLSGVFGDMPVLADALVDAGCVNHEILDHCRKGDEHVRGCWLIDRILSKDR